MRIRRQTWGLAVLFLIAFCWLGYASISFGALFEGLHLDLPFAIGFVAGYGRFAFPLLGIIAALAFALSDTFSRYRWVQVALTLFFSLLIIWGVTGFFAGGSFMVPTIPATR